VTAQFPVLLTSCGQSPGPERVVFFLKRLKADHEFLAQAKAEDLIDRHKAGNPYKAVIIVTGASLKGMGAAGVSMIPTSTGAAKAMAEVFPQLKGRLDGLAVRVPTTDVSLVDFTFTAEKPVTVEALNSAFRAAAAGPLKGILEVCEEPLVSIDFRGTTASSIVDALSTIVIGDKTAKVFSWYDNEYAYAARCVDVAKLYAK